MTKKKSRLRRLRPGFVVSYDRIGDIYQALGDTKSALTSYESSLKIREELRKRNPDSADYARDLYVSFNNVGYIYMGAGDTKKSN
ncbi:MAG: tetratricopeptide repeat protein [Saprospiraceae bacterium]|nr:tetratricopeptide repeat protein [Saprospiraceae bacterium]